ncbi:PREDICTED: glutathione S-transferase T2-like [Brassica oleracea var. oleracea]|uniref:glutathione S-transferase T2-like n=1 Tax=Brassica oleracea var. oleracea TaxID=109376 RepID=UPI0006A6B072|nr:PREDICTED: glutathione S-transferase T2-like [Brassica oleracea var. oleracea]
MPTDDVLLISSWLNTSKDSVVGNKQRSGAFCPSTQTSKFVDLLNSQQTISFGNFEDSIELSSNFGGIPAARSVELSSNFDGTPAARRERRKWMPTDDVLLISSWLNTSKDSREACHCKQRWHKISDLVCKFCGCYEADTREKSCGQTENDILKLAHQIFYNNHNKKFTLEHAWKEFWNNHKWCELSTAKNEGSSKKENVRTGQIHQALEQLNPSVLRVLRLQRLVGRRRW